jgi:hypothetical protein
MLPELIGLTEALRHGGEGVCLCELRASVRELRAEFGNAPLRELRASVRNPIPYGLGHSASWSGSDRRDRFFATESRRDA